MHAGVEDFPHAVTIFRGKRTVSTHHHSPVTLGFDSYGGNLETQWLQRLLQDFPISLFLMVATMRFLVMDLVVFLVSNPFTINRTDPWMGEIQFFIDALDRAVPGQSETEVIINRFPINLQLQPGPYFTNRINYTGIYSILGLQFDMNFRVQCSKNYYGPNCKTFCAPRQNVYTCDSEGRVVCIQNNRDPATKCTTILSVSGGKNVAAAGLKIGEYLFPLSFLFMLIN